MRWDEPGCDDADTLGAEYFPNGEGWSLAVERECWPWQIASSPGKVRSLLLDIASQAAKEAALEGRLQPTGSSDMMSAMQTALKNAAKNDSVETGNRI